MGRLVDARHLPWCRRLARHVNQMAHRDWEWRVAGRLLQARAYDVADGPL